MFFWNNLENSHIYRVEHFKIKTNSSSLRIHRKSNRIELWYAYDWYFDTCLVFSFRVKVLRELRFNDRYNINSKDYSYSERYDERCQTLKCFQIDISPLDATLQVYQWLYYIIYIWKSPYFSRTAFPSII